MIRGYILQQPAIGATRLGRSSIVQNVGAGLCIKRIRHWVLVVPRSRTTFLCARPNRMAIFAGKDPRRE